MAELPLRLGDDRKLCPAYRANDLIRTPPRIKTRSQDKKEALEKNSEMAYDISGCFERCMEEYFRADKVSTVCTRKYRV